MRGRDREREEEREKEEGEKAVILKNDMIFSCYICMFSPQQLRKGSAENINVQVFSIRRMTVKAYGIFIEPFS